MNSEAEIIKAYIKHLDDNQEFRMSSDKTIQFYPKGYEFRFSAMELRWIADELDNRNAVIKMKGK